MGRDGLAATALIELGRLAVSREDYERARGHFDEALALSRKTGDTGMIGWSLGELSRAEMHLGQHEAAHAHRGECLRLGLERGGRQEILRSLAAFANLASARGRHERAARLFGAVEALYEAADSAPADLADTAPHIRATRAALGEAAFEAAWTAGRAMTLEMAMCVALEECEIPTTGGKDS
jgi:tetratricopeptide (TPR) repeat protein